MKIQQQRCLLTGATGGIGKAIASQLSQAGYSLILQGRNREKLQELLDKLVGEHEIIVADLIGSQSMENLCAQLSKRIDIDLLINNAGTSSFGLFAQQTPAEISELMMVNLTRPMQLTQHLLPQIKGNKGMVINVGSVFGSIGFPCFTNYCASKFGLKGFSEALARELKGEGVTIGYFSPRSTATAINSDSVNEMNRALGNAVDHPSDVAKQLLTFIKQKQRRKVVGWPEKIFARLNGLFPELVDRALENKVNIIKSYLPPKNGNSDDKQPKLVNLNRQEQ